MKVLFYGNCQLGVLAKQFRLNSQYEVLDCRDFDFVPFWRDEGLFAVWSPANFPNREQLKTKIVEAVKQCDVFIFQHYNDASDRPPQITTEYLCSQAPHALQICLPSFWYNAYLNDGVNPVLQHLHEQGESEPRIIDFLKTETAPFVEQLFQARHEKSIQELRERHTKQSPLYPHFVPCLDWICTEYSSRLLAYTHSHPSFHYYNYMLHALHCFGLATVPGFDHESEVPGSVPSTFWCGDLFYFRQLFPGMEDLTLHRKFFRTGVDAASVAHQLSLINA